MSAPRSAATEWQKEKEDLLEEARILDLRRQAQIANQIDVINRLLEGHTYDDVCRSQTDKIVRLTVDLSEAEAEISRLRAEKAQG